MSSNLTLSLLNVTSQDNLTTSTATENDIRAFLRYEWTGLAAMIANLFIILIIMSEKGLRQRLPLYVILAMGDIINGFYFFYANFNRLREIYSGLYYHPMSKWDCAMMFYSLFQLLGTQFPALIALLISLERFLAVQTPIWYHSSYRTRHRVIAVCICATLVFLFLLIHYATSFPLRDLSSGANAYCALTYSSAANYNRAHQAFITVTRLTGFAFSGFAFIQASRKSKAAAAMRREALNVVPILVVSAFSLTLVTVPQVGLLLTNNFSAYPIFAQLQMTHWILLLTCVNSLTNIFIYFFFTRDFRRHVLMILTFKKANVSTHWAKNATTAVPRSARRRVIPLGVGCNGTI